MRCDMSEDRVPVFYYVLIAIRPRWHRRDPSHTVIISSSRTADCNILQVWYGIRSQQLQTWVIRSAVSGHALAMWAFMITAPATMDIGPAAKRRSTPRRSCQFKLASGHPTASPLAIDPVRPLPDSIRLGCSETKLEQKSSPQGPAPRLGGAVVALGTQFTSPGACWPKQRPWDGAKKGWQAARGRQWGPPG